MNELDELSTYVYSRKDVYNIFLDWRQIFVENGDIICTACGGSGTRTYGSTSTWRGGIGGQMMTSDVCDKCWGSGASNRPWTNLRKVK